MIDDWLLILLMTVMAVGFGGVSVLLSHLGPGLTNIRLLGAISSLGAPWWLWRLIGQPGRRILLRGVRSCCHPRCRTFWMGLHKMDTAPAEARVRFLDRVGRKIARLR